VILLLTIGGNFYGGLFSLLRRLARLRRVVILVGICDAIFYRFKKAPFGPLRLRDRGCLPRRTVMFDFLIAGLSPFITPIIWRFSSLFPSAVGGIVVLDWGNLGS